MASRNFKHMSDNYHRWWRWWISVVVWDSDDDGDGGLSREKYRSGAYRVTSGGRQVWEIRATRIGVGHRLNGDCREGIPNLALPV